MRSFYKKSLFSLFLLLVGWWLFYFKTRARYLGKRSLSISNLNNCQMNFCAMGQFQCLFCKAKTYFWNQQFEYKAGLK